MPTRIRFTFYGEAQVDRTFELVSDRASDATPVWNVLADRFVEDEQRQFASEGAYGSGRWAPLSAPYAAWKARHFPGRGILVRTGALRDSLTGSGDGSIRAITQSTMAVGSAVDYGRFHQRGDGVPRRRPVELPESERRAWVKAIHRFIVTGEARV